MRKEQAGEGSFEYISKSNVNSLRVDWLNLSDFYAGLDSEFDGEVGWGKWDEIVNLSGRFDLKLEVPISGMGDKKIDPDENPGLYADKFVDLAGRFASRYRGKVEMYQIGG